MATKTNTTINGKGYYRITRTIGHEIIDGKKVPVKKQFYGPSKTAANKKYEEWKAEQESLMSDQIDSVRTLGELIDYYYQNVFIPSEKYAESTKELYARSIDSFRRSQPSLFAKPIRAVSSASIQEAYNRYDVAQSTLKATHKYLRGFWKWALVNGYADINVLDAVTLPKKKLTKLKEEIVIWTDEEIRQIFDSIGDHRLRLLVFIAYYTGMRISEILGLRYEDLDGTIRVRRQNYHGAVSEPKYGSKREIPMHPDLIEEIARHKEWHEAEMKRKHYKSDYVFTSTTGTLLDYRNVLRSLNRFYDQNGIPRKSPHAYRATFCTNLCKAGVPLQTASSLMGHRSVSVTARYYTFVSRAEKEAAIQFLSR